MVDTSKHLLTQPIARKSFYKDGITIELEKQRLMRMSSIAESSLSRDDYEKWVWDGYSNLSAAFLLSPPVAIGHMGGSVFQIAVTVYPLQPCLIIVPLVGRYFGRKGATVNRYGANLAAAALPGQEHSMLHNQLQ